MKTTTCASIISSSRKEFLDPYVVVKEVLAMFPIRDCNPSGRTPYVTWALIAINLVAFLAYWPAGTNESVAATFQAWGLVPSTFQGLDTAHTVFTSMFIHGGWIHLGTNLLFLWIFGDNLEDEMGALNFLGFYVVCGVLANLLQVLAAPNSVVPIGGASGAIAGVMGGYLLMFPKARVDLAIYYVIGVRMVPVPAWALLSLWFGLQVWGGLTASSGSSSVAFWAHVGGFLWGVLLTYRLWQRHGGSHFWGRFHGLPPHPTSHVAVPVVRRRGTVLPPVQSTGLFAGDRKR